MQPLLILLDGSFFVQRAFHASPPMVRKSDGQPTGAVHGYCSALWGILQSNRATHLAAVFDLGKSAKRQAMIEAYRAEHGLPAGDYKGQRAEKDPALASQFDLCRAATRAFGVPLIELEHTEADDIIATLATRAEAEGYCVEIQSADKDIMQLVSDRVWSYCPIRRTRFDVAAVVKKFGVPPHQVAEVQGLCGDLIDGFKGVPGIGPTFAARLIKTHGSIDGAIETGNCGDRIVRLVRQHAELARLCRSLATLDRSVTINVTIEGLIVREPNHKQIDDFLRRMEFSSLAQRIAGSVVPDFPSPWD